MAKYPALTLAMLLFFSNCFADTFIHRDTGESFNGYATQKKKRDKTHVRIERRGPQYLDLSDYEVQQNHLGRKNKVFVFSIKDSIDFIYETEVFEKAIVVAANQGPLFILIEIDTPGGRADLAQRICAAITSIDNCRTVAFVSGGKFGGAFSVGAMIALACNQLYMADNTAIGAVTLVVPTPFGDKGAKEAYGQTVGEKVISANRAYMAALAEQNNRPAVIAKAMVDEDIEVVEVIEDEKTSFVEPENKEPNQTFVKIWSKKGSLLTLTASEAVHCNIADKIIPSAKRLLVALDAANAGMVRNTGSRRAKRRFERARSEFDEVTPAITYLKERADELLADLNQLEWQIRRSNPWLRGRRFYSYDYRYGGQRYDWFLDEMLVERGALINELLIVLRTLRRRYETAVRLARQHLDLNADIDALVEGLNSTIARYNEVRSRLFM